MNDILPFSAKTHTFEMRFGSFAAIEIISKMFKSLPLSFKFQDSGRDSLWQASFYAG